MAALTPIGTLTILSGASVSEVLNLALLANRQSTILGLVGPAALTGVVTVLVAPTIAGPFAPLQSPPGTDVNIAALKAISFTAIPFGAVQLQSTATEGANRVFTYIAMGAGR